MYEACGVPSPYSFFVFGTTKIYFIYKIKQIKKK